jgi:hypothetical protein
MSSVPYQMPIGPRPALRHVVIRFDPTDAHPKITELCLRERETHDRGDHEHIDFVPDHAR